MVIHIPYKRTHTEPETRDSARGYWCMAFEAFNAIVKRAANKSNFKCELVSLMIHWSMKSAIALSGKRCQLSAEEDS